MSWFCHFLGEHFAELLMAAVAFLQVRLLFRQTKINERLENLQRVVVEAELHLTPKQLDERMEKDQKREGLKPVPKEDLNFLE